MDAFRREFLKLAGTGLAGATASAVDTLGARADVKAPIPGAGTRSVYDVRTIGASGDGKTIDSPAINKAIETAAAAGGDGAISVFKLQDVKDFRVFGSRRIKDLEAEKIDTQEF
jgi:hypothetical protein